jgi:diacylglycerol kinase family enzyme
MAEHGIRKGVTWGTTTEQPSDVDVAGSDADLADAVLRHPRALIRFLPSAESDLAATLGIVAGNTAARIEVALDALRVGERLGVASVVVGVSPSRTRRWHRRRTIRLEVDNRTRTAKVTGVVAMTAQHLGGARIIPRGHPGDGRAEAQWFGLAPRDRAAMRARLGTGDHLGHPDVGSAGFRSLTLSSDRPLAVSVDGVAIPAVSTVVIEVVPGAFRLLI